MNKSEIIAIDFDGVLVIGDNYPDIGEPNLPMIKWAKERKDEGAKLILWTSRIGEPLVRAVEFCSGYELEFDAVNENLPEVVEEYGSDSRKIHADVYIDDKAINSAHLMENIEHKNNLDLGLTQIELLRCWVSMTGTYGDSNVIMRIVDTQHVVFAGHVPQSDVLHVNIETEHGVYTDTIYNLVNMGIARYVDRKHNEVESEKDAFGVVFSIPPEVLAKYNLMRFDRR